MARIALDLRVGTSGGVKTYIQNLVPALLRLDGDHEYLFIRVRDDGLELPPGVPVIPVPFRQPLLQYLWVQSALPGILRRRGVDIYHSLKHVGPVRCGAKTVHTQSAVGHFWGNYPLSWKEQFYWNRLARITLRRTDRVIAISRFVAEGIPPELGIPEKHVHVIYYGLDPDFRTLAAELADGPLPDRPLPEGGGQPYILAVGNVLPVKNFGTLVRAYAKLPRTLRESYRLLIAGGTDHPEADSLRELCRQLKLADRVGFCGFVGKRDLIRLYHGAELFVLSSLHESFSVALLEAMASETCCLCVACGGAEEVGGDAVKRLPDPRDVEALAAGMTDLLQNDAERRRLAGRAAERSHLFSWEENARQTLDVYEQLLSRPPALGG
jgi:glycosyltransferase involved in cell wall biosynthesis